MLATARRLSVGARSRLSRGRARLSALAGIGASLQADPASSAFAQPREQWLRRARTKGIGHQGVDVGGGVIDWDSNPDLTDGAWRGDSSTVGIGRQMTSEDPEAARIIWEYVAPILTSDWECEASDPADPESLAVADWCERAILGPGWTGRLLDHLLMRRDGVRLSEWWYRFDPDAELRRYDKPIDPDTGIEARQLVPVGVARSGLYVPVIEARLPHTIDEWVVEGGQLVAVIQSSRTDSSSSYGADSPTIPADRLMVFTFAAEGNNIEGQSILRPCWAYWQLRRQIMTYMGIGLSRWGVGTPVVREKIQGVLTPQDWTDLRTMAREYGVDANAYLMEIYGAEVDILEADMKTGDVMDRFFDRLARSMHRAAGTEHVFSGEGYGAKSHIESKTATFNRNIQHAAHLVGEVYTERLIPELLAVNGIDARLAPTLRMGTTAASAANDDAMAYEVAASAGLITPQLEDEERFRSQHGWPQMSAATLAQRLSGPAAADGADDDEPEPEPEQDGTDEDEGAAQSGHTCGVVALAKQPLQSWNERAEAYAAKIGPVHALAESYFAAATSRLSREDAIVRASADVEELIRAAIDNLARSLDGVTDIGAAKTTPIPELPEIASMVRRHLQRIQTLGMEAARQEVQAQRSDPMWASRLAAAFAAADERLVSASLDDVVAMGRTVGKGKPADRPSNALDDIDIDAQLDDIVSHIVDSIEADIRVAVGQSIQAQQAAGGAKPSSTAASVNLAVTPSKIRSVVQPGAQGVYATGKAAEGRSQGGMWGVYTLTPELGGPDGQGHTPCIACQQRAEDPGNPFLLGSDAELEFVTPNPECFGGARCWCEVIIIPAPEGATGTLSGGGVEAALSLVTPGGDPPLIHLTGPSLAGKTFLIRRLQDMYGDELAVWDVLDFYRARDVIDEDGRVDWKRRSQVAPEMRDDLLTWLQMTRGVAGRIIESSGINRTIEDVLSSVDHLRISLCEADGDEFNIRARQRGIDPGQARGLNGAIKRRDPTPPVSQAAALHLMLQVLPELEEGEE